MPAVGRGNIGDHCSQKYYKNVAKVIGLSNGPMGFGAFPRTRGADSAPKRKQTGTRVLGQCAFAGCTTNT